MLSAIVAMVLAAAVGALTATASELGLSHARDRFLALRVAGAGEAAIVAARSGSWLDSTVVGFPGRRVVVGSAAPRPDTRVDMAAWWLSGDLWLLFADVSIRDRAGATRARATVGIIVQIVVSPVAGTRKAVPITRGWIRGFQ